MRERLIFDFLKRWVEQSIHDLLRHAQPMARKVLPRHQKLAAGENLEARKEFFKKIGLNYNNVGPLGPPCKIR